MLHGIPHTAGKVLAGVAGVVALGTAFNTVALVIETARRVGVMVKDKINRFDNRANFRLHNEIGQIIFPYNNLVDFTSLGVAAGLNYLMAVGALWSLNKWAPSVVPNANMILKYITPIQITPGNVFTFLNFRR